MYHDELVASSRAKPLGPQVWACDCHNENRGNLYFLLSMSLKALSCLGLFFLVVPAALAANKQIVWGHTSAALIKSENVLFDCIKPDGNKVCCAAVNQSHAWSRGIGIDYERYTHSVERKNTPRHAFGKCEVTKEYIPSPYELRDLQYAKDLQSISDINIRRDKLLTYVTTDEMIDNSTRWMNRVKIHMESEVTPPLTDDDFEFLSRFHMTKVCRHDDGRVVKSEWDEWIEPLTIHIRHPFAFADCGALTEKYYRKMLQTNSKVGIGNVDYVLLQSGMSQHNQSLHGHHSGNQMRKHVMIDAGASTFDSSLFWFTCGYSQVNEYDVIIVNRNIIN